MPNNSTWCSLTCTLMFICRIALSTFWLLHWTFAFVFYTPVFFVAICCGNLNILRLCCETNCVFCCKPCEYTGLKVCRDVKNLSIRGRAYITCNYYVSLTQSVLIDGIRPLIQHTFTVIYMFLILYIDGEANTKSTYLIHYCLRYTVGYILQVAVYIATTLGVWAAGCGPVKFQKKKQKRAPAIFIMTLMRLSIGTGILLYLIHAHYLKEDVTDPGFLAAEYGINFYLEFGVLLYCFPCFDVIRPSTQSEIRDQKRPKFYSLLYGKLSPLSMSLYALQISIFSQVLLVFGHKTATYAIILVSLVRTAFKETVSLSKGVSNVKFDPNLPFLKNLANKYSESKTPYRIFIISFVINFAYILIIHFAEIDVRILLNCIYTNLYTCSIVSIYAIIIITKNVQFVYLCAMHAFCCSIQLLFVYFASFKLDIYSICMIVASAVTHIVLISVTFHLLIRLKLPVQGYNVVKTSADEILSEEKMDDYTEESLELGLERRTSLEMSVELVAGESQVNEEEKSKLSATPELGEIAQLL